LLRLRRLYEAMLAAVQVLQRGLPRPSAPELVAPSQPEADASTLAYGEAAEALLRHELAAMVKFDNAAYPIKVRANISDQLVRRLPCACPCAYHIAGTSLATCLLGGGWARAHSRIAEHDLYLLRCHVGTGDAAMQSAGHHSNV